MNTKWNERLDITQQHGVGATPQLKSERAHQDSLLTQAGTPKMLTSTRCKAYLKIHLNNKVSHTLRGSTP